MFDAFRTSDDVIDVPADDQFGTKRRLVMSIRESSPADAGPATTAGIQVPAVQIGRWGDLVDTPGTRPAWNSSQRSRFGQRSRHHPNTLRYRMRRTEEITGINLGDAAGRLLTERQLALHRRRHRKPAVWR